MNSKGRKRTRKEAKFQGYLIQEDNPYHTRGGGNLFAGMGKRSEYKADACRHCEFMERIEEKIDVNVYPTESAIKSKFVGQVKKARTEIKRVKANPTIRLTILKIDA